MCTYLCIGVIFFNLPTRNQRHPADCDWDIWGISRIYRKMDNLSKFAIYGFLETPIPSSALPITSTYIIFYTYNYRYTHFWTAWLIKVFSKFAKNQRSLDPILLWWVHHNENISYTYMRKDLHIKIKLSALLIASVLPVYLRLFLCHLQNDTIVLCRLRLEWPCCLHHGYRRFYILV